MWFDIEVQGWQAFLAVAIIFFLVGFGVGALV